MVDRVVYRIVKPTTHTIDDLAPDAGPAAVSTAVVCAVAEAKGCDAEALDACLYDVVDPDALERLFRYEDDGAGWTGEVGFSLAGCDVVVRSDGRITVTGAETGDLASPDSTFAPTSDDARNASADRGAGARDEWRVVGPTSDPVAPVPTSD